MSIVYAEGIHVHFAKGTIIDYAWDFRSFILTTRLKVRKCEDLTRRGLLVFVYQYVRDCVVSPLRRKSKEGGGGGGGGGVTDIKFSLRRSTHMIKQKISLGEGP